MGSNSGSTRRRRFDVPISPVKDARTASEKRLNRPAGRETSRAAIDAGIVVATTLAVTILLLAISGQISDTTAGNLIARSAPSLPDKIIPAQATPQLSLIATPEASRSPTPEAHASTPSGTPDEASLQAEVEKKLRADPVISVLGIKVTVGDGQIVLAGTAPTEEMRSQVEKLVRTIKGVKDVDNQIIVSDKP